MRDNKQNLEKRLADILSEYMDRLNEGTAPPVEEFLNQYGSFTQNLKPMLEAAAFAKDKIQVEVVPAWKKAQAFEKTRTRFLAREQLEKTKDTTKEIASVLQKRWHPVLLLLWARGKIGKLCESIKGRTRMDKLVFVMKMEGKFTQLIPNFYAFEPYRFGPYEKELFQDLETLKNYGLIEIIPPSKLGRDTDKDTEVSEGIYEEEGNTIYRLSEKGKQFADALAEKVRETSPKILEEIEYVKCHWGAKNLRGKGGLVTEVYKRWPKYIGKSEIKEEILDDEEYE